MRHILTSHRGQELGVSAGLEEEQTSSERNRLSENTATQLQQDRNASLNRSAGSEAVAVGLDLHVAHSSSAVSLAVGLVYLKSQFTCKTFQKRRLVTYVFRTLSEVP